MFKMLTIATVAIMLAGCSAAPAATPTPTPKATYGEVVELRDAAVAAGYPCPSWNQDNRVTLAAGSGSCSSADVFSVYLTQDAVQQLVTKAKGLPGNRTWLVGQNWVINAPDEAIAKLQPVLGGQRVEFN